MINSDNSIQINIKFTFIVYEYIILYKYILLSKLIYVYIYNKYIIYIIYRHIYIYIYIYLAINKTLKFCRDTVFHVLNIPSDNFVIYELHI